MKNAAPISISALRDGIFPPSTSVDIVGDVEKMIRKYVILPKSAYLPLAIWCAATWLADCFECFPYLALLSPAKRSGKTRLLEVLETLCAKVWRGTAPTSAALFRMMADCPTLLLDEVEGLRGKNVSEPQQAVLAVLNAGHRRGATVPRFDVKSNEILHFPVYGPKAFAAIGKLPDTLSDRSIIISMQRKTKAEEVARFLFGRAKAEAQPIIEAVNAWSQLHDEDVRAAYESSDDLSFLSDRDSDLWTALFALCSVAAPERLGELKTCAIVLSNAKEADDIEDSLPIYLLGDVWDVWPAGAVHVATTELVARLRELPESPWSEIDLTARKLAWMLRPFGVERRQVRIGTITTKGYTRSDLETAVNRYLPSATKESETSETDRMNTGEKGTFQ